MSLKSVTERLLIIRDGISLANAQREARLALADIADLDMTDVEKHIADLEAENATLRSQIGG
jgi:hypothetical protein